MNDFTKEELQEILFWASCTRTYYNAIGNENSLIDKIKSMIKSMENKE
jgi:hypothetical protein